MKSDLTSLFRTLVWIGLLSLLLAGTWGCGKKIDILKSPKKPLPAETKKPEAPEPQRPVKISQTPGLMADAETLFAQGNYQDALFVYNQALAVAGPEEKEAVLSGIEKVLAKADPATIQEFIQVKNLAIPEALLLYWLGRHHALAGNNSEALDALTRFSDRYPDHPHAADAAEMILAIKKATFRKGTIGCLLPLSGKYGVYGQKALQGIQLALQDFSGNYGTDVNIIIKDTQSDPQKAAKCVEELAKEPVMGIVGPLLAVEAAGEKAQELQVPLIALTQKHDFPLKGDYLFSNFITPEMQVKSLASYIFTELGIQKVAILYPDERYGKRYMELFWDVVDEFNGEVVGAEAYDGKKTDFGVPIKKLTGAYYTRARHKVSASGKRRAADLDFQALFIPDSPSRLNLILPQLVYNDAKGMLLLGTNIWHQKKLLASDEKFIRNAVITDGYFGQSQNPRTAAFDKKYTQVFGTSPGFLEAVSYDTAAILFQHGMQASVDSRQRLKESLTGGMIYEGVTGNTIFDENGNARKQLFLITVRNGQFMEIRK